MNRQEKIDDVKQAIRKKGALLEVADLMDFDGVDGVGAVVEGWWYQPDPMVSARITTFLRGAADDEVEDNFDLVLQRDEGGWFLALALRCGIRVVAKREMCGACGYKPEPASEPTYVFVDAGDQGACEHYGYVLLKRFYLRDLLEMEVLGHFRKHEMAKAEAAVEEVQQALSRAVDLIEDQEFARQCFENFDGFHRSSEKGAER